MFSFQLNFGAYSVTFFNSYTENYDMKNNRFLDACRNAIGTAHILNDDTDKATYLTDQRQC